MTFADSVILSLIGLGIVFLVLILLSLLIQFQSIILTFISELMQKKEKTFQKTTVRQVPAEQEMEGEQWTAGELKLLGVDEKTAAMIMAIISDESQIPLSELQFKMIKAID
jgi:Na+-transporting methylmalonyl-CoA/oxaloacetate decarboxylase gamma subunit